MGVVARPVGVFERPKVGVVLPKVGVARPVVRGVERPDSEPEARRPLRGLSSSVSSLSSSVEFSARDGLRRDEGRGLREADDLLPRDRSLAGRRRPDRGSVASDKPLSPPSSSAK